MTAERAFPLSLRERVGVRGRASAAVCHAGLRATGTIGARTGSQDPLTPALSRREREQAVAHG